jgi:hypothetical protein
MWICVSLVLELPLEGAGGFTRENAEYSRKYRETQNTPKDGGC